MSQSNNGSTNQPKFASDSKARKALSKIIQNDRSYSIERKPEIEILPINEETKEKILYWLYDLTLIKEGIKDIEEKLPKICKNGLLFVDLLNRLEGKHDTIKGV